MTTSLRNPRLLASRDIVRKITGRSRVARAIVLRHEQWRFVGEVLDDAGLMHLFANSRALPRAFAPGCNERVVEYPWALSRVRGAATEARAALDELCRICRPGGRILLTVPYGRRMDMGWQHQFCASDVDHLLEGLRPDLTIYRKDRTGWQLSDRRAASDCEYHGGARAVLCAEISC